MPETSAWTTDGAKILRNGKDFFVKGVNYAPVPIGGTQEWGPILDWFTDGSQLTIDCREIWKRDLSRLQELGANAIRTYATWPWIPTDANYDKAQQGTLGDARSHQLFLDTCAEHGIDVLITINPQIGDMWPGCNGAGSVNRPARNEKYFAFFRQTVDHMSRAYGAHPAVMGFCIGNEFDKPEGRGTAEFYDVLNALGKLARDNAPTKIVTFAWYDATSPDPNFGNDQNESKMTSFDVVGINCYEGLGMAGNLIARHRAMNGDGRKVKPLLVTEWGCPFSTRESGQASEMRADQLPALKEFLQAEHDAMAKNRDVCAGGFYFEWCDEYWKQPGTPFWDHGGEGKAEPAFPGGYWDEKWFGIMAIQVAGGRPPKDPVNTQTGKLYPIDVHTARPHFQYIAEMFQKAT
jgi:hypothetical protein